MIEHILYTTIQAVDKDGEHEPCTSATSTEELVNAAGDAQVIFFMGKYRPNVLKED